MYQTDSDRSENPPGLRIFFPPKDDVFHIISIKCSAQIPFSIWALWGPKIPLFGTQGN